jgi:hypothetical protein
MVRPTKPLNSAIPPGQKALRKASIWLEIRQKCFEVGKYFSHREMYLKSEVVHDSGVASLAEVPHHGSTLHISNSIKLLLLQLLILSNNKPLQKNLLGRIFWHW